MIKNNINITKDLLKDYLPSRDESGDKYAFGNALIIAGCAKYTGAPFFASVACQRSGVGLVRLVVPESIHQIESVKLNETIVIPCSDEDGYIGARAIPVIEENLPKSTAVLVGPGLGFGQNTRLVIENILNNASCPVIIDADGLNSLKGNAEILNIGKCKKIITPHCREFCRLFGFDKVPTDDYLEQLSVKYDTIIVYKCDKTRISTPDGIVYHNVNFGNCGMAKGGSGDVLAGMITSFVAQKVECGKACALAVGLHAMAGDIAAEKYTKYCMTPTDMLESLAETFRI